MLYPSLTTWQVGGSLGLCVQVRDSFCAHLLNFLVLSHWDRWSRALRILQDWVEEGRKLKQVSKVLSPNK